MSNHVTTIRVNVEGGAECEHRWTIANAIACHDFPGMPSLAELEESAQDAYLRLADQALRLPGDEETASGRDPG